MKIVRLLATLSILPLLVLSATAQERSPIHPPSIFQQIPNETVVSPAADRPLSKPAQGTPLNLGNGAVPTGLQGWYDYQSNGQSPTWIRVNPDDPNEIHTVYMLSTDGSVFDQVGPTRRVGYSHSTDGGKTWSPTLDISGISLRLGFPYLQLADVGLGYGPLIAAHGGTTGSPSQTMFFAGTGGGSISQLFTMELATASGRVGSEGGVIWPAFAPHGDNEKVQEVVASLIFRTGENAAPLQIATADFDEGSVPPWRDFNIDSLIVATSGGRYIMDRAPSGKLGVVFHQFLNFDDVTLNAIRLSESTDNGATWSEPAIIFTDEDYFEENLNGDVDTLAPQSDLDFAYMGEDPHVVFGGTVNNLFRFENIYHWSASTGKVVPIATTDLDSLRGITTHPQLLFQPGGIMGLSYPSISLGDDGKHIVVAYTAQGQISLDVNQPLVASEDGFGYLRIWMVGSTDGGETWGANRVLHNWAGDEGIDSASVEYPSLNETCRVDPETGDVTIDMAFQARRKPGMYAFIVTDVNGTGTPANRGPLEECFQYHQRTELGPDMFQSSLSVDDEKTFVRNYDARIKCYPNPASNSASILFTTPRTGLATVKIYDALGRAVMTVVDNERLYAASHLREVALDALPAGTYRVVVSQGDASSSQPLNVVH